MTGLMHEYSEFEEARAAEKAACARQNALAARTVAGHSLDAADCDFLLRMLGLDAAAGMDAITD
ncbi:hypothetical protein [Nocardia crassostreae]|uniref:hypothetical protein n=1 Tax=Nocardia crassostreae TaxID=53428 RepID=UPI0008364CCB|nr:hypothetical protein [Nocardia crassostreae]